MACDECNYYFSFWAIFCPSPPNSPRNQSVFKKCKKRQEYPEADLGLLQHPRWSAL